MRGSTWPPTYTATHVPLTRPPKPAPLCSVPSHWWRARVGANAGPGPLASLSWSVLAPIPASVPGALCAFIWSKNKSPCVRVSYSCHVCHLYDEDVPMEAVGHSFAMFQRP